MSVYVDDWRQLATIRTTTSRWSHLTADTTEELLVGRDERADGSHGAGPYQRPRSLVVPSGIDLGDRNRKSGNRRVY